MQSSVPRLAAAIALVLAVLGPVAPAALAQGQALTTPPAWEPDDPQNVAGQSTADEPAAIAKRLFAALLDREPSALEREQAASQIDQGQTDGLVNMLIGSSEYRQLRSGKNANGLLEQYYQGLLGRSPDSSAFRAYIPQLNRGDDVSVIKAILGSAEFDDVIAGGNLEASSVETACMQAVGQRVSSDMRRSVELRFLTVDTSSRSFLADEIRGTARMPDSSLIEFGCTAERLRGTIADVSYRVIEEAAREARIVRCESRDARRRECPADTGGGVTLVRQLSRTTCRRDFNWGFTEQGIWVDGGCRADFRIMEAVAVPEPALELAAEGRGYLRHSGGQPVWFDRVRLTCQADGSASLVFDGQRVSGSQSDVPLSGTCYRMDEERIKLGLSGGANAWHGTAGGSVDLSGGSIVAVSVAGRDVSGQAFEISFTPQRALSTSDFGRSGEGLLELADGRRATISGVQIEPLSDGRITFVFDGQTRFGLSGAWFPNARGGYEVTIDGGLNGRETRGAGTVDWSNDGRLSIELVGTAASVGGAFRLSFASSPGIR